MARPARSSNPAPHPFPPSYVTKLIDEVTSCIDNGEPRHQIITIVRREGCAGCAHIARAIAAAYEGWDTLGENRKWWSPGGVHTAALPDDVLDLIILVRDQGRLDDDIRQQIATAVAEDSQ